MSECPNPNLSAQQEGYSLGIKVKSYCINYSSLIKQTNKKSCTYNNQVRSNVWLVNTSLRTAFNRESISDKVSWNNTTGISWMFRVKHPPGTWIRGHMGSFSNYVDQILPFVTWILVDFLTDFVTMMSFLVSSAPQCSKQNFALARFYVLEIKPCGLKFKNFRCLFLEL